MVINNDFMLVVLAPFIAVVIIVILMQLGDVFWNVIRWVLNRVREGI